MKPQFFACALLLVVLFFFVCCKKDPAKNAELPAATQDGKGTLGFLLNGQPWTPKGSRPFASPNLSIDFDPGYRNGIVNIVAYDFTQASSDQFTLGVKDSLNYLQAPFTLNLSQKSLYGISFNKPCEYFSSLNGIISSGSLTITKLDKTNRIIAGTFNATLSMSGCETINITEGRFDMKY